MKSFQKTLGDINAGSLVDQLGEDLASVVKAVSATGKKGELRITFKIAPTKGGRGVSIDPEVKVKAPEFDKATEFYFALANGELSRSDPMQRDLPLRDVNVDRETGEIREVAAA